MSDKLTKLQNFIGGNFVECDRHLDSVNPSTGKVHALVPDSGAGEADAAVAAAKAAFPAWAATPVAQRSAFLNKIADKIEENLEEFARAESIDQGKTISFARQVDIPRSVYNFRFFATAVLHQINESSFLQDKNALNYVERTPVGVASLISPWNLPLYLLTFKMAPALATGNTVVAKPSELASMTAWLMCRVIQEVGLPSGVVNVVFGTGPSVGSALVSNDDVSLVSFTGSTVTGAKIRSTCANSCKKLSLELGGKNPAIIFADCDVDDAVATSVRSSFANQGEICLCTSRIFVENSIFDDFVAKFVAASRRMKVGPPLDENTQVGALNSKAHMEKVLRFIDLARAEGCGVLCGAGVDPLDLPVEFRGGFFVPPTVLVGVADESKCMKEEIFGPVTCIVPFESEEEAIWRANDVVYGLCATVFSRDVKRCHRVARKLEAGTVWVNCWMVRDLNMPFGGVKSSGEGREGFKDSLEFYTQSKTVCVKL